MTSMNIGGFDNERSLIATLARIDTQIAELDALLLKSLTVQERHRITDELEYLKIQRRKVARKLKLESGDGVVPELNDMAAMEDQQQQQ